MRMPSCWDGVNLDSADHRAHMAYTKNGEADGADLRGNQSVS